MGRKKVLSLEQVEEARKLRKDGYSLRMLSKKYGVSIGTLSNATKEGEAEPEQPAEAKEPGKEAVKPTGGIQVKAEIISEEQQPSAVKAAKQGAEKAKLEGEAKAEAAAVWERWKSTVEILNMWGINTFVLNGPEDTKLDIKDDSDRLALENVGDATVATLQYYFPNLPEGSPIILLGLAYSGLVMQVLKKRAPRPKKEKVRKETEELKEVMEEPELSEEDVKVIEEIAKKKKPQPLTEEEMSRLAAKF